MPSRILLAILSAAMLLPGADSKAEIDNQWVHVVRVRIGPHESLALAEPADTVEIFLTDCRLKIARPDGTAGEMHHKAGDVAWIGRDRQTEANLSDQPFESVLVELKPERLKPPKITLDPVKLDPEHHLVPFENDRVRVLRTILEPHLKSPVHEHPSYVVVYLTELHTTMKLADGRLVDNPRKPGEIAWRDAYSHQTENIGDHTAMEIQVELK